MSTPKIAFCFPGQGSLEAGMGREIAYAVPEAMDVFRRGMKTAWMRRISLASPAGVPAFAGLATCRGAALIQAVAVLRGLPGGTCVFWRVVHSALLSRLELVYHQPTPAKVYAVDRRCAMVWSR